MVVFSFVDAQNLVANLFNDVLSAASLREDLYFLYLEFVRGARTCTTVY